VGFQRWCPTLSAGIILAMSAVHGGASSSLYIAVILCTILRWGQTSLLEMSRALLPLMQEIVLSFFPFSPLLSCYTTFLS
jgi:hypothetical protein